MGKSPWIFGASVPVGALTALALLCPASCARSVRSSTDNKMAALRNCAQAYGDLAAGPLDNGAAAAERIAVTCADLYSERACAAAFQSWRRLPADNRIATIVGACRDAYCPALAEPKPSLCTEPELPEPSTLLSSWEELNLRILALEMGGPSGMYTGLTFPGHSTVPISFHPAATEAARESPLEVTFQLDASGSLRVSVASEEPLWLQPASTRSDFQQAAHAAKQRVQGRAARAIIAADSSVSYGRVISLVDALKQEGFSRMSFSVAQSP